MPYFHASVVAVNCWGEVKEKTKSCAPVTWLVLATARAGKNAPNIPNRHMARPTRVTGFRDFLPLLDILMASVILMPEGGCLA